MYGFIGKTMEQIKTLNKLLIMNKSLHSIGECLLCFKIQESQSAA